jgi:hypothetical protein
MAPSDALKALKLWQREASRIDKKKGKWTGAQRIFAETTNHQKDCGRKRLEMRNLCLLAAQCLMYLILLNDRQNRFNIVFRFVQIFAERAYKRKIHKCLKIH